MCFCIYWSESIFRRLHSRIFLIEIYGFEGTGLGRYGVPRNGIVSVTAFHQSVNEIDRLIAKSSIREEK